MNSDHLKNIKFYTVLTLLIIAICLLSIGISILLKHQALTAVFLIQSLSSLSCYILLGIGIGLPLVILATILGWVQLILLLSGNISPHLSREGFFKVLSTLFTKI